MTMIHPTEDSVTLEQPILRGETAIEQLTLRKPSAGELRGASLADLLQMDVNAVIKVLPRITTPTLTEAELRGLAACDLVSLATAVVNFLLPKSVTDAHSPAV
jgi:hypothetical protein